MSEGNLDPLRNTLYQKTAERRGRSSPAQKPQKQEAVVESAWKEEVSRAPKEKKNHLWIFLGGSVIFFVLAVVAATLILLGGGRTVSPENLEVLVSAPSTVASGEVYEMEISVTNRNPVALPFVELTVSFPKGARDPNDFSRERGHLVQAFEALSPGQKETVTIPSVFFGEEGQESETLLIFEFRAEGSNAVVVREERLPILISSAPLSLFLDMPETVVPGGSFIATARLEVQTEEAIPDVVLIGNYPFGFEILNAEPASTRGDRIWELGTLESGDEIEIEIEGRFAAQSGSERVLVFKAGTGLTPNGEDLQLVYMQQEKTIAVESSALGLSVLLNGSGADTLIVDAGSVLSGRIALENNLGTDLFGSAIQVTLSGSALDESALDPRTGLYQASTNTIIFNRDTDSELEVLEPKDRSVVTFEVPVKSARDLRGVQNPTLEVMVTVSGREVGQGTGSRPVTAQTRKTIQVIADLELDSTLLYSTGTFSNSGPWPMEAGEQTTYTLDFEVENTVNTVASTELAYSLPSYVKYTGRINGLSGGTVAYNEQSGTLTISLGELAPGEVRNGAVQLSVTPSTNQTGSVITIVNGSVVRGVDRFTKESVQTSGAAMTSRITQDPEYTQDKGFVAQ